MTSMQLEDHDPVERPISDFCFDDISTTVATDPLFQLAWGKPEEGGWGVFAGTLYNACDQLGVERVRDQLKFVRAKRGIGCRSRYLITVLKSLGYKPTGKRLEEAPPF